MTNFDELFEYDSATGVLTWKHRPAAPRKWNTRFVGKRAGTDVNGYVAVTVDNRRHYAHRVIWEMRNGPIPVGMQIDHINRIKSDNRLANLRLATNTQNAANVVRSFGQLPRGVSFHRKSGTFNSTIRARGKRHSLGYFPTAELAGEFYELAAAELHGAFYVAHTTGRAP